MRARRRGWLVLAVALATVAAPAPPAAADVPPPARVTSRYETATGNSLGRDCGYSAAVPSSPATSIWAFCDTAVYSPFGDLVGFIGGSTAAVGPYTPGQVPTGLSELPTPPAPVGPLPNDRAPAPFLPTPSGLVLPDGSTPCGTAGTNSYPASWISGLSRGPDRRLSSGHNARDLLFFTYVNVCVTGSFQWTVQSFGLTYYDPAGNAVVSPATVFRTASAGAELPWQRQLGSPHFAADGYLYLFGSHCDDAAFGACGQGRVILARTPWRNSAGWANPGSYRYWTPGGWVADRSLAQSVVPAARPFGIDVHAYPGSGLALIEQTSIAGHYRIWRAGSPTGPWSALPEAVVPGCESSTTSWCYAFIGHPELSTATGLLMSFYDPDDTHVRVIAVPW